MPSVIIDGKEVQLPEGQRLNGIQAARLAGIEVPHYCWHPGLTVVASCRMCLVETGRRDPKTGQVSMIPKLVPACQTPADDNTVFVTNTEKVRAARAMVEEDLLLRHPVDCPICDKAGECLLQDYHFEYGQKKRRADIKPFHSRRRTLGDTVTLFVDRCVMCSRCVRFCREVAGTGELMVANRGAHEEIDVFPGQPLANKMSGNVVDLCPVGALGDRDFLYQQRVWFMKRHKSVCSSCSTGCSIFVDENQDRVYRLRPRENMHVNKWWMCDEGRYGWKHVHDARRIEAPRRREGAELTLIDWPPLLEELDRKLRAAGRLALVLSPFLTCEEAYLACQYIRDADPQAIIAVGPIPQEGEDEHFPGGFVIHAEKCPNRRGIEKIAARFQGTLIGWDDFLMRLAAEEIGGVWITAGYPHDWINEEATQAFASARTLIVQDLFESPLTALAHCALPAATFAEREGSYVNFDQRLQSFEWAIRPPAGVRSEGQIFWRLLERPGLYKAKLVLEELARDIAWFAPAAGGVPETGIDLKVNQVAEAPV